MSFWQRYFVILICGLSCVFVLRAFFLETYRVGQSSEMMSTLEGDILLGLKAFPLPRFTEDLGGRGVPFVVQSEGSLYLWPSRVWASENENLSVSPEGDLMVENLSLPIQFASSWALQEYQLKPGEIFVYPLPEGVESESLQDHVFLAAELRAQVLLVLFRKRANDDLSLLNRIFLEVPKMKAVTVKR